MTCPSVPKCARRVPRHGADGCAHVPYRGTPTTTTWNELQTPNSKTGHTDDVLGARRCSRYLVGGVR